MSEDISSAIVLGRKQEEYNREIADSDLVFFLFFTKTGQYTLEEFDVAMESFKKTNKPIIVTYFKIVDAQSPTEEVEKFMKRLDQEIGHYYNTYGHIDSLKLGIMMQIKMLGLDGMDVQLKDGKAMQGGMELLALDHIEPVSGHTRLQQRKEELIELKSRFVAVKANYLENPDDTAAYDEFLDVSNKRNEVKKSIEEMEGALYSMMENMYKQIARGNLSARQVEAYRLIERGKCKEAEEILNFDEIIKESRIAGMQADTAAARAQVNVNELLQLKDIKTTLTDWTGVDACLGGAMRMEERHNLPKKAMHGYVVFLFQQKRYLEGIGVAEKLQYHYQSPDSAATDEEKGDLYFHLGALYASAFRYAESEEMHKAALDIRGRLAETDPDAHEPDLARSYGLLGDMYGADKRFEEAEKAYRTGLDIRAGMVEREPENPEFRLFLSNSYHSLGFVYSKTQRYEEAESMLQAALDIRRALTGLDQDICGWRLSQTYITLSYVYTATGRFSEAERILEDALAIRIGLAQHNPGRYESLLANNYKSLGDAYKGSQKHAEAAEAYNAAIAIRLRLVDQSPGLHERHMADCYYSLGEVHILCNRSAEAEGAFMEAKRLYEKHESANKHCAEYAEKTRIALARLGKA
jgi:tetratricopeptide (TPR) repeat protein